MTAAASTAASTAASIADNASPAEPFRQAFARLHGWSVYIYRRVLNAVVLSPYDYLPSTIQKALRRNPRATLTRVERALFWLEALQATMRGSRAYLRRFGPVRAGPPVPAAARATIHALQAECRRLRGLPPPVPKPRPARPSTEVSRDLARRARIRRLLQSQTIGAIARRICRDLGLQPGADQWPDDLVNRADTPEQYLLRLERPPRSRPALPPPISPSPLPLSPPPVTPTPPPYHKRE